MDPQAAALGRYPHEAVQDIGMLSRERGELVDHHHESGRCLGRIHRRHVLRVRPGKKALATPYLGLQGGQRPCGRRRIEIGEHPGGVGQTGQRPECGSALVIDQDQSQARGRQVESELEQPGDQQLGLARTGRPRHESVRAITDQVGDHHPPVAHPDHRGQRIGSASGGPQAPARPDAVAIHLPGDLLQDDPLGQRGAVEAV